MRAGVLRHRADFRTPVRVSNGQGGQTVTYPTVTVSLRCEVVSLSGTERLGPGGGVVTTGQQMLRVRRHPAVSVKQRVDVTFADTGQTVPFMVERVERTSERGDDDRGVSLTVYCTALES